MSDDRLTKTGRGEDARLLDAAARARVAAAVADIRLPPSLRLTEWQRATIGGLARVSLRAIENELRLGLAGHPAAAGNEALHAALTSAHVAIAVPMLERSGAHTDPPLVALLIRRAEEHRRARGTSEAGLLLELIRDKDEAVADEAMAILIAQSRGQDRFGEPASGRIDLPGELEHRLTWRVAAALRLYMVDLHGVAPAAADEAVIAAAERFLATYDEGESLDSRAAQLMRRLDRLGRLDDPLVGRTLSEGSLPLFLAALGVRARLDHAAIWEILSDPSGRGAVLLLRAAGVERERAAAIFVNLGASEEQVTAQLDRFDVTSPVEAREGIRFWQVDPAYREALAEIAA